MKFRNCAWQCKRNTMSEVPRNLILTHNAPRYKSLCTIAALFTVFEQCRVARQPLSFLTALGIIS